MNRTLPEQHRTRDIYVVGAKQLGKTTFLLNCVIQDILLGKGVAFLDPHGDAAEELLKLIPKSRIADTIYFDPLLYTIPINLFGTRDEKEIHKITDDVIYIFRRFSGGDWGVRMDTIARYVLHTLLKLKKSTFLDIYHILTDPRFREGALQELKGQLDPDVQRFWDSFKETDVGVTPIISRMSRFVRSKVTATLSSPTSNFNLYDLMNEKKVIICNLSEGKLGDQESSLLGSLIVSQFQVAAMRRTYIHPSERVPFHLYVDEFQNFISSPFPKILSEAGKYRLHLIFAHQYIGQLDTDTRSSIFGNSPIIISFRVGHDDAPYLSKYFSPLKQEDLVSLPKAHIAVAVPGEEARVMRTLPPPRSLASWAEQITSNTRQKYAVEPHTAPHEPPPAEKPAPPDQPQVPHPRR